MAPGRGTTSRPRALETSLEDLEVALLGLDDVVEESVDRGNLAILVELVVEGGELRLVLEAEDLHEVVRTAAVLVDCAVRAADRGQEGLELAHEVEELAAAAFTDGIRDRQHDTRLREIGNGQRTARGRDERLALIPRGRHRAGRRDEHRAR